MIGDSITHFSDQSLFVLGSNLPHYVENPPEYTQQENLRVNGVIIQFEKDFMQYAFSHYSQFQAISRLLKMPKEGCYIHLLPIRIFPIKSNSFPKRRSGTDCRISTATGCTDTHNSLQIHFFSRLRTRSLPIAWTKNRKGYSIP